MDDKALHYSRVISVMAQQDALEPDAAITFCRVFLPQMLAELDVLNRMVSQRVDLWTERAAEVPLPPPAPTPAPVVPAMKASAKKTKSKPKRTAPTPTPKRSQKHGRRRP
jgi:hypothetical protein